MLNKGIQLGGALVAAALLMVVRAEEITSGTVLTRVTVLPITGLAASTEGSINVSGILPLRCATPCPEGTGWDEEYYNESCNANSFVCPDVVVNPNGNSYLDFLSDGEFDKYEALGARQGGFTRWGSNYLAGNWMAAAGSPWAANITRTDEPFPGTIIYMRTRLPNTDKITSHWASALFSVVWTDGIDVVHFDLEHWHQDNRLTLVVQHGSLDWQEIEYYDFVEAITNYDQGAISDVPVEEWLDIVIRYAPKEPKVDVFINGKLGASVALTEVLPSGLGAFFYEGVLGNDGTAGIELNGDFSERPYFGDVAEFVVLQGVWTDEHIDSITTLYSDVVEKNGKKV